MSFIAAATLGVGAISAGTQMHLANKQRKQAEKIQRNAVDPGIQPNYGLQRTNQILANNYSNFELPGLTRYQEGIATNSATAMSGIRQGATSSEDILAGAVRVQDSGNEAMQGLYTEQARGKINALNSYLGSINAVGNDQVRMNNMELDRYDSTMREAAALGGAANQNLNNGIQDLLTGITPMIQNFLPQYSVDQNTGLTVKGQSRYKSIFG